LERVIHAYGMQENFQYTIIRPFNYIGPRIDFLPSHEEGIPRVFSFFMDALLYKKPIYLVNGGNQQRCYTDIRDATQAHMLILENTNGLTDQQIINIGHRSNEISIKELALKMCKIWKRDYGEYIPELIDIDGEEFYGKGYDDSDRRIPILKKIEEIGWVPKYSIEDILNHSMEYYVTKFIEKTA
jgi:nucleoside-diphosphate-sugar epimerase